MSEILKDAYIEWLEERSLYKKYFGDTSPRAAKKAGKAGRVVPGTKAITGEPAPNTIVKRTGSGRKGGGDTTVARKRRMLNASYDELSENRDHARKLYRKTYNYHIAKNRNHDYARAIAKAKVRMVYPDYAEYINDKPKK